MINFYTKSTDAWSAMFEGIKKATRSIYIEMYIFSDDTASTHDFVGLLELKARSGVQVILILDAFGSVDLSKEILNRMINAGVEILFFHHFLSHTHRKLVIVDGNTAFLGGTNISEHSRLWNDLQVKVGKRLAHNFIKIFHKTYILSGGKNKLIERPTTFRKYKVRTWIIDHLPLSGRRRLRAYYEKKISSAKNSIIFVTPYFIPAEWFMRVIAQAIHRGVKITILVPSMTDYYFLDKANSYYISLYASLGCTIYSSENMNHAKALLIDNLEGMVGSGNLDSLSFNRNSELGIFFTDKNSIQKLTNIIDKWIKSAKIYNEKTLLTHWYDFIFIYILKITHPML